MATERVLVVDDETTIVNVVAEALRLAGYKAVGARSAEVALDLLAGSSFDLVVTDVMMPGLGGLELLRRIREVETNVVVIVMTGKATLDVAIQALEAGAHAFLIKPFSPAELRRTIETATQRARLLEENVRLRALVPLLEASRTYVAAPDPASLARLVAVDARRIVSAQESLVILGPAERGDPPRLFGAEAAPTLAARAQALWDARDEDFQAIEVRAAGANPATTLMIHSVPLVGSEGIEGLLSVGFDDALRYDRDQSARSTLDLLSQHAGASLENARGAEDRETLMLGLAAALANALDARDTETGDHCQRMMTLAEALGREIGLGPTELRHLRYGALLHDIGKIGIPDNVLRKREPLSADEWDVMREHTIIGQRILAPLGTLQPVAEIVRHHHEHFDGSGYPDGLTGESIPIAARAVAVVDAYCAMTEDRPYQAARTHIEAIEELLACAGDQFDAAIVDAMLRIFEPPGSAAAAAPQARVAGRADIAAATRTDPPTQ